jgi:hypothetical protein
VEHLQCRRPRRSGSSSPCPGGVGGGGGRGQRAFPRRDAASQELRALALAAWPAHALRRFDTALAAPCSVLAPDPARAWPSAVGAGSLITQIGLPNSNSNGSDSPLQCVCTARDIQPARHTTEGSCHGNKGEIEVAPDSSSPVCGIRSLPAISERLLAASTTQTRSLSRLRQRVLGLGSGLPATRMRQIEAPDSECLSESRLLRWPESSSRPYCSGGSGTRSRPAYGATASASETGSAA